MPPKRTAKQYAKGRRDEEARVRATLVAVIPDRFFTQEIEDNGDLNQPAKLMTAAKSYIDSLEAEKDAAENQAAVPFLVPASSQSSQLNEIKELRQCAQRIVHKAEEKVLGSGNMTNALRDCIEEAKNAMIDVIERIENIDSKNSAGNDSALRANRSKSV